MDTSPVLLSEGVTSIRETVRSGLGIAVLPDWLVREDLISGRLVRILPQWKAKDLPVHVVYSAGRVLPIRVRAFVDFAVGYMTKALGSSSINDTNVTQQIRGQTVKSMSLDTARASSSA
jgi:DNA-binding transcriptional LysR family regulator